ncbi:hypothetical protein HanIR_Chr03g0130751 [Helianthus annuus]|nr:hypothetical protein HanIR_Chr03g0130751 [Helianthus annuus]
MIYASGDEFCDVYELNHIRFVPFFVYLGCFKDKFATCLRNGRIRFNAVMNAQRSGSSNKRISK